MEFAAWFRMWLARHPLKRPADADCAKYTAQVMRRIAADRAPAPAPSFGSFLAGLAWPRVTIAVATIAVVMLVAASARQPATQPVRLAESQNTDEQWIQETTQLLDQLGEEWPQESGADANSNDQERWLDDLEQLDDSELATNS